MDRHNYIEILSEQIRCKKALPLVTRELEDHIEEQKEDFMAAGMTEWEAEEAAVREMGDPVEVGVDMDRIHRPKMNWLVIILIGLFNLSGLGIQWYLDSHMTADSARIIYGPIEKYLIFAVIGFVIMIGVCYIDYTRIAYRAKELMIIYFVLFVVGILKFGVAVNGVNAAVIWFWGNSVNTRMVAFLFVPLYCAVLYSYRGQGYLGMFKGVVWMIPIIVSLLLSSITEMIIFIPVLAVILSIAVYKKYFRVSVRKTLIGIWSAVILIPFAGVAWIFKFGAEYQEMRLRIMVNPSKYAMEGGYQFYTLRKLLQGSKVIGTKADFSEFSKMLPDRANFVLAYIAAYFGILFAALVIGVILMLFFKMLSLTLKQQNQLGMIMGAGCGTVILVHIVMYVLTNMGIIPLGYVYCPFIMNGRSGAIVTYILLGIMLSIYRHQNVSPIEMPQKMFQRRKCQE